MRDSKKEKYYWEGFRDKLVRGFGTCSCWWNDSAELAYQRGTKDAETAIERLKRK